jgi:hypothetical protein
MPMVLLRDSSSQPIFPRHHHLLGRFVMACTSRKNGCVVELPMHEDPKLRGIEGSSGAGEIDLYTFEGSRG